jgi:hypothetical protein
VRRVRAGFEFQRWDAGRRGIGFELSYEQWLDIWQKSGHLDERGPRKGQYVMARIGDNGSYAVGNVEIITAEQNHKDYFANVVVTRSAETRVAISDKVKAAWRDGTYQNRKPRKPYKRVSPSAETRAKISDTLRRRSSCR